MWLALHPLAEDCSAGGWRLSDAWSLKTSQLKRKKERNRNIQYISTLHADVFILTYSCQNWNYVVQRFYCFSKFKHNITSHWHWKLLFFILDIQNDFQVICIHISFTCIKVCKEISEICSKFQNHFKRLFFNLRGMMRKKEKHMVGVWRMALFKFPKNKSAKQMFSVKV